MHGMNKNRKRTKELISADNRRAYIKRKPDAKQHVKGNLKPETKLCIKCNRSKLLTEFDPKKQHCQQCKEEAAEQKKNRVKKERTRKAVVKIEKIIKPPKPIKPKTAKQERPSVKVILPIEDVYGRTKKDVRPGWDNKIMEGIRLSVARSYYTEQ